MKIVELLMRDTLPNKKFFNGNEIASILNIQPHEIRAWESEFPQIRSYKTARGQRIYRREDVILFASIKHLLKEKKLTIAGAQRILAESDTHCFLGDDIENVAPAVFDQVVPPVMDQTVLEAACAFLPDEEDEFDDRSHRLYQQCAEKLHEPVVPVLPHHLGEMLQDGVYKHKQECKPTFKRADYDKARATLLASKDSLRQVLLMLDKYDDKSFIKVAQTA